LKKDNELKFTTQNQEELKEEFIKEINNDNFYKAIINYNRLNYIYPDCYLYLANFYSKIGDMVKEINSLLKLVTIKDFNRYNGRSLLHRLNLFFYAYNGFDVFDYYKDLLKDRFSFDEEFASQKNPYKEDKKPQLKLVKFDSSSLYEKAKNHILENDAKKAYEVLNEIKPEDKDYKKAQFFKFMIEASEDKSLLSKNALNSVTKDMQEELNKKEETKLTFNEIMLKSLMLFEKGNYIKAKELLEKVNTLDVFGAKYLKRLILLYSKLNDTKKLEETLKMYICLYPKDALMRVALIKFYNGEEVDFESFMDDKISKQDYEYCSSLVLENIINAESINNKTKEEANFIFYLALRLKDPNILRAAALSFLQTNKFEVVQDSLFEVDVDHVARQILFQSVVEIGQETPLFLLVEGKIKELKITYPKIFLAANTEEDNSKKERLFFLRAVYSQLVSILTFCEIPLDNFYEKQDKIFEHLFNIDLEKSEILNSATNIVCALALIFSNYNKDILRSFKYIKKEEKQKVLDLFNDILLKI